MAQGSCHDRGVSVAKGLFHLLFEAIERRNLIKLDHNNDCLLPDHLVLVLEQLVDSVFDCYHNLGVGQFRQTSESSQNFEVTFGLQIFLNGGDHQNNQVGIGLNKQRARQVADSFDE